MGGKIELLGAAPRFSFVDKHYVAHLSFPAARFESLASEIKLIASQKEVFAAEMQKLVGTSTSPWTAGAGRWWGG